MRLLCESFIWSCQKGILKNECRIGDRRIPIPGSKWPGFGFDEWFLNAAFHPRAAFEGVMTFVNWRATDLNQWFALDIEYCTWANPKSESLLWNLEKGHLGNECTVGGRKIPYAGGNWPDYCFDEYFLNTAIFPRAAKEGILTMLSRRDTSQSYWLALDIEHCMKANPASEIIHFGQPWRDDVPEFSWSPEEAAGISAQLTEEGSPLISVCVALKNRSRVPSEAGILELFPNCVRALARLHEAICPIELVVADFHSDDWPLEEWLEKGAGAMRVHRLEMDGQFSRGRGMNAAVAAARSSQILIYDADMLMDETAFLTGLAIMAEGKEGTAFFPMIQNLDPRGKTEDWYEASFGMVFLPKKTFVAAGGIPEFQNWGGDDEILYEKVARISRVDRFKLLGLDHQWHPVSCRHQYHRGESHEDFRNYRAREV